MPASIIFNWLIEQRSIKISQKSLRAHELELEYVSRYVKHPNNVNRTPMTVAYTQLTNSFTPTSAGGNTRR